jgi:hypothetical protein
MVASFRSPRQRQASAEIRSQGSRLGYHEAPLGDGTGDQRRLCQQGEMQVAPRTRQPAQAETLLDLKSSA